MIALDQRHLQGALALSVEARWNQTLDDWKVMMVAGNAIGIDYPGGHIVGSALTLPYGEAFGWISMVLVARDWRRKGLATRLLTQAIEMLESDGLIPVLDATPAGQNVYLPLGFEPHFSFQRWELNVPREIPEKTTADLLSRPACAGDMDIVKAYDRDVFGGDRSTIVDALASRSGGHARISDKGGYILSREGRVARQIGPICADNSEIAIDMLEQVLAEIDGPVFVDACNHQRSFVDRLKAIGFKSQRPFLRMARFRKAPFGDPGRMFALAGPELG